VAKISLSPLHPSIHFLFFFPSFFFFSLFFSFFPLRRYEFYDLVVLYFPLITASAKSDVLLLSNIMDKDEKPSSTLPVAL